MKRDLPPDYFEAIMQIRNPNDQLLDYIKNQINKRGNVFIAKVVDVKNGIDLFISDQRFARALGNKLKRNFKGELKTSRKLFTQHRQTSKLVYRVTVCFRCEQIPPANLPASARG